jgi:hypothetical protein
MKTATLILHAERGTQRIPITHFAMLEPSVFWCRFTTTAGVTHDARGLVVDYEGDINELPKPTGQPCPQCRNPGPSPNFHV